MSIRKIDLVERIASVFDDGSISIHPESYSQERAEKETWDKKEDDLAKQPKIARIRFHIVEILVDPAATQADKCPTCGREKHAD